jgi:hypothetical protein
MRTRVNVNAEPICDLCEQEEFENVARKRQASRKLVALCVELRCYNEAAQIVAGFADLFVSYSRRIEEVIALVGEEPMRVSFSVDLEPILNEARQEIGYFRRWEKEVLETLSEEEAAGTLRAAFRRPSADRAKLLHDVMTASDRYLETNAIAWSY